MKNLIEIYSDGSCEPNPGPGGWAFIVVRDGVVVHKELGSEDSQIKSLNTTNNRMEYLAVISALKWVQADDAVTIFSDSQLLVKTVNEWMNGWKSNGWKKKGGEIKNLDLVKMLDHLKRLRPKVCVKWIKAHNGHVFNEMADELAEHARKVICSHRSADCDTAADTLVKTY